MSEHETLVFFGGAVKALGDGKVGGYLVRYGDTKNTDLENEYFTADTYLGSSETVDVYYQHGMDETMKRRVIGGGTLKKDDVGVWIEAQLALRDEYEKAIYDMIESGKQGWSSGTASHLMEREADGKSSRITRWPIVEASITPTPAEPRNGALPLKSLINSEASQPEAQLPEAGHTAASAVTGGADDDVVPIVEIVHSEDVKMTDNVQPENVEETPQANEPSNLDEVLKSIDDRFSKLEGKTSAAINGVLNAFENSPRLAKSGYVTVDGGTADKQIKNAADFLLSLRRQDVSRLKSVYGVKAQTEGSGPAGGYYVPDEVLNDLLGQVSLVSRLGSLVRRIPVGSPAGEFPIRDYSRTPTSNNGSSATAQGIESQARAEAGAYGAETAYFEMVTYRVTDATSGYVRASRELSEDFPQIASILASAIEEDVQNREEFFILRGTGIGQPLGVLNWAGAIEVTEDTDNTFAYEDATEMMSRLLMAGSGRYAFVHHPYAMNDIAQMTATNIDFVADLQSPLRASLLGAELISSQHLPAQGTDGYVILGDWSKYLLFERGGLYIDFSEHADFTNGNDTWRFGKRIDGKPVMTSAVTLADGSSTLSPFVWLGNLS